jgi:di/tricarboxylate transporter
MLVVFLALCRFLFRDALHEPRGGPGAARAAGLADLRPSDALTDRRLLARCLAVLALVLIGFALHTMLHLEPAMVALLGAGLMVLVSRTTARQYLEEVEWPTLVFFMALFVLVGGLVQVGVIAGLGQAASDVVGDRYLLAATLLIFGSAVLGAFVDNIPYTAAMAPIVDDVVTAAPDPRWAGPCGGRSRWAPTSAATPPRSPPERTWSSPGSPPAKGTPSASGSSPATVWSSPPSPSSSPGSTCGCATTHSCDGTGPGIR